MGYPIQIDVHTRTGACAHLAARTGQSGGSHVLNADNQSLVHHLKTGFHQKFFHEGIADLDVGPLCTSVLTKTRRCHRRAVNPVTAGLSTHVDHPVADTRCLSQKDLVLLEYAERKGIDQRVLRVAIGEIHFASNGGNAKTIAVGCDTPNHTLKNPTVLSLVKRTKAQAVHRSDRPGPHSENVAEDPTHSCGRTLEGLDIGRMVMRFDLEGHCQPITDIDDAGVFPGTLKDSRPFGGQTLEMNARALVAAVFAPHHTEDTQLSQVGFPAEYLPNPLVLLLRQIVFGENFFGECCQHWVQTWERAVTMDSKIRRPSSLPSICSLERSG